MTKNSKTIVKGVVMLVLLVFLCTVVWMRSSRIGSSRKGLGASFGLDLEQYLDVDPALVKYDEIEPIDPGLADVSALAVGPDRIYVGGAGTVIVMDGSGSELSRFTVDGDVRSLAVDAEANIFAGVGNHIEIFDASGRRTATWDAAASNTLPVSIVLRGEDVLVGDARKGQILSYDRSGTEQGTISGLVLFSSPALGMAVDSEQKLWVVNPGARELRRYDKDGTIVEKWNRPGRDIDGFSGCCNPVDIAMRADGNIVASEKSIVRVKVVTPTGELVGVVAGPRSFDQDIMDLEIEVDSQDRVLVLDPIKKTVRIFVPKAGAE